MSEKFQSKNVFLNGVFWEDASKYAASSQIDENFANELAYVMVTLHRTGA